MKLAFVRSAYTAFAAAAVLLAACGDTNANDVGADKLAVISEGTPRDSVLAVMGQGPLASLYGDSLRLERGFRRQTFLIDGATFEVLYYRELQGNVAESVQQAKETPIVLRDGVVLGWGWKYYVNTAMPDLKLPNPTGIAPGGGGASPPVIEMKTDTAAASADGGIKPSV